MWHPPQNLTTDLPLKSYINNLKLIIKNTLSKSRSLYNIFDHIFEKTLTRLSKNINITIKPSDKNLGLVILDTLPYKAMCLKHLEDINTYRLIDNYNPNKAYALLRTLLSRFQKLYDEKDPSKLSKLTLSLTQLQRHTSLRIAPFYVLPKIHKTLIAPIPGRPIVSSNSTLTYHASVYLDKELQPVLKLLNTVCTSSRSIVFDLQKRLFSPNSVILCADITALYPNIPIILGIDTVAQVLRKLKIFTTAHLNFLMSLLHWVLTENYCTFNGLTYLQLKGTAMGTPVAVTYSNIFLYGIEFPIITRLRPSYFQRYIDDVFSIFDDYFTAEQFVHEFNSVCPTIKFEAVTIQRSGIMLDLEFTLFYDHSILHDTIVHKVYQKERNIYQYIPIVSEHNSSIFSNFILQELKRYSLFCSKESDFHTIVLLFTQRLIARGYSQDQVDSQLLKLPSRSLLLSALKQQLQPTIRPKVYKKKTPIVSICAPRLDPPIRWQHFFTIPPSLSYLPIFSAIFKDNSVIIGTRNPPTIGSKVIRSKYTEPPLILL